MIDKGWDFGYNLLAILASSGAAVSKIKNVMIGLGITGSILAGSPSFSQNEKAIKDTARHELVVNMQAPSLIHDSIIKMDFQKIIDIYGKKQGLELIRKHFLEEINQKRMKINNTPLRLNPILNDIAQSKAKNMADHDYFDHTDDAGLTDVDRMIKDGRYHFQRFGSNISYNIKNIDGVIQSYIANLKWKTNHYDVIGIKENKDLGVGLIQGKNGIRYIVVNFGNQLKQ